MSKPPDQAPAVTHAAVWVVPALLWAYYSTPLALPGVRSNIALVFLIVVPPAIAIALLALRRRFPVGVALATGVLLFTSPGVLGAACAAQASLARRAGRGAVVLMSGCFLAAAKLLGLLLGPNLFASGRQGWDSASQFELTLAVAAVAVATLAGWLIRSRAAESRSRADVDLARREAEQERLERARLAEREQIAREMHDVLAHRLSLVSLHAGVLAFRQDLDAEETRQTAQLIQRNARQSLDELRSVLSTLRGADAPPEPPQPSLTELAVLVADIEASQHVELATRIDPALVPARISRHAYRIIQEGLTNARKHAPGAPVRVELSGEPGGTLDLTVSNPLADLAIPDRAGNGFGLLGIAERAASVAGSVTHGSRDGRFTLAASLPWRDEA